MVNLHVKWHEICHTLTPPKKNYPFNEKPIVKVNWVFLFVYYIQAVQDFVVLNQSCKHCSLCL